MWGINCTADYYVQQVENFMDHTCFPQAAAIKAKQERRVLVACDEMRSSILARCFW